MTTKSYGFDCNLAHDYVWWLNHLEPDLTYDRLNENREKPAGQDLPALTEDSKDAAKTVQPPFTIKDSGPSEFVNTTPKGTTPRITELALIEVCPNCDTVLRIYKTKDFGRTIYRCSNCFVKLKMSQMGWVVDDS